MVIGQTQAKFALGALITLLCLLEVIGHARAEDTEAKKAVGVFSVYGCSGRANEAAGIGVEYDVGRIVIDIAFLEREDNTEVSALEFGWRLGATEKSLLGGVVVGAGYYDSGSAQVEGKLSAWAGYGWFFPRRRLHYRLQFRYVFNGPLQGLLVTLGMAYGQ